MRSRAWVSAFIVVILALQLAPVAREFTGDRETLWPFLAWGMYRHSSRPPVQATVHRVLAVTEAGPHVVRAAEAGFDRFAFRRYYQVPIASGDSVAARDLARRLARDRQREIQAIVGEESELTLTEDGVRERTRVRLYPLDRP